MDKTNTAWKGGEVIAKQEDEQDERHTKWLRNKRIYKMTKKQGKKKSLAQHTTKIIKSYVQHNGRKKMKLKIDDQENNRQKMRTQTTWLQEHEEGEENS